MADDGRIAPAGQPPELSPSVFTDAFNLNWQQPFVLLLLLGAAFGFVLWLWIQLRSEKGTVAAGGMSYVVGPQGSGKSMFGVRVIINALRSGKYAVTNVRLLPGWEYAVAAKLFPRDRGERRAARARALAAHYIYEGDLGRIMRFRLPCAYCGGSTTEFPGRAEGETDEAYFKRCNGTSNDPTLCSHVGPDNEGRAVVVWDETHNDLNNRTWNGMASDKGVAQTEARRRASIVTWCTQLRKLGYSGYLLSQHQENTDAQLRRVCNYIIRLQNQRSRGIGVVLPRRLTMFLVYWYPSNLGDGSVRVQSVRKERYLLPWHRYLYDSWDLYGRLAASPDADVEAAVQLPAGGWYNRSDEAETVRGSQADRPGTPHARIGQSPAELTLSAVTTAGDGSESADDGLRDAARVASG